MKRVVVTGIGLVTPLGCGVNYVWNALLAGKCGVRKLENPEYDKIPSKVAARVPGFNASEYVTAASEIRTMSPASLFALAASIEAVKDTDIVDFSAIRKRTGVAVGMGMSDLEYIIETANILKNKGPSKISPYFVPRILTNMAAGIISIKHGFHGPNHSVSTACATGAHSIGIHMLRVYHLRNQPSPIALSRRCHKFHPSRSCYCNGLRRDRIVYFTAEHGRFLSSTSFIHQT